MDKTRAKQVFAAAGLPVARGMIACREQVRAAHPMEPPYVVKPNDEGSSVGVYIVPAGANRPPALADTMPERVLVEEYVAGREMTVAVLGDRPLTVTDIIADGWYDYDAKYRPGGSRHVVPAEIPAEISEACLDYRAPRPPCDRLPRAQPLGLSLGRDARPGRARHPRDQHPAGHDARPRSRPEQAAHAGMSFGALVRWLVEDASCSR